MDQVKVLSQTGNPQRTVVTVDDLHSKDQVGHLLDPCLEQAGNWHRTVAEVVSMDEVVKSSDLYLQPVPSV